MKKNKWPYDVIAEFYDYDMALNMPFDDTKAYLNMMGKAKGKIIEFGAGNGRLTLPFLNAGWHVLAIDRSKEMLDELLKRVKGFPNKNNLHYLLADAEKPLKLDIASYDVVVLPYSMICYLTEPKDVQQLLVSIHKSLNINGKLIVDAFIPNTNTIQSIDFTQDYHRQIPQGSITRFKRITHNIIANINLIERRYIVNINNHIMKYETFSYIRPYTPKQLCETVRKVNFHIEEKYFDYSLNKSKTYAKFFTLKAIKT